MSRLIGMELSQELMDLLNSETVHGVLATVTDADQYPNTTPLYFVKAVSPTKIRICLAKAHQASANLMSNGKMMLSILEGNDVAVSIKGKAKLLAPEMRKNAAMMAFEVEVLNIKSDTTSTLIVESGVRTRHRSEKAAKFLRDMFDELVAL